MARRVRPVVLAASLALLAGCSVGGQPSVGAALPATTSSSATPTTTPAAPAGGRPTVTVTQATTLSPSTQGSLQVAPADFTAFSDLNWAARWNDSTTDPDAVSDCEQLEDEYPSCWSVQAWNGNVSCPTGVVVEVDLYDGKADSGGPKVGSDFGISIDGAVAPYSSTRLLVLTKTTFPSGTGSAAITGMRCAL